ncbi:DUF429 domain-containing protein [Lacrimispora sp.]|uniref:DUF429 domain-containing protein n=1 Tax=Lacrimispora sp. TaxID=2719234 RepID=UPI002FD8EE61
MKGDYITTYTKLSFSPLDPKPEDIRIVDIAHALSLMTRANGHFKRFYSVAQHSINCALEARAMGCARKVQLACLLHDASEAYLSDITRPVKKHLPSYLEIENKLQGTIRQVYGLSPTDAEHAVVKQIDDTMLWHEFFVLMDELVYEPKPIIHSKPDFSERPFRDVENQFLWLFNSLTGEGKTHKCVGVDGTKGGWLAACMKADAVSIQLYRTIHELCAEYSDTDSILIDIPIGLPESDTDIRPDNVLRNNLKGKASSVFNTPCRQAVYASNYEGANAINKDVMGKGLSKQSFAICEKIKEVDAFLQSNPDWKNRLVESHPEYGFALLNVGAPVVESKKKQAGVSARISLLRPHITHLDTLLTKVSGDSAVKNRLDDILDALCLAVIGELGMAYGFFTLPDLPPTDSKGLKMQIVGSKVE